MKIKLVVDLDRHLQQVIAHRLGAEATKERIERYLNAEIANLLETFAAEYDESIDG